MLFALLLLLAGVVVAGFVTRWAIRIAIILGVLMLLGALSFNTVLGWGQSPALQKAAGWVWTTSRSLVGAGVDSVASQLRSPAGDSARTRLVSAAKRTARSVDSTRRSGRTARDSAQRADRRRAAADSVTAVRRARRRALDSGTQGDTPDQFSAFERFRLPASR